MPTTNPDTAPGRADSEDDRRVVVRERGCGGAITVWAVDQFKNLATGYTGTVNVTSDDPRAILPAPYTFTAADGGIQTLPIDFRLPNAVTFMVADAATESRPRRARQVLTHQSRSAWSPRTAACR